MTPAPPPASPPSAPGPPPAGPPPLLSVVAPCFNEAGGLGAFHDRVGAACRALGRPYEVVLVNDGSSDGTWSAMEALARADPALVCVNLSRNHGHQLALLAGLQVARGARVLVIDADLQDPPELLPELMAAMDGGADVVYGRRRRRAGERWHKRLAAALFYRVLDALADAPIPRDTGDFRLMSRRVLDVFLAMPERHRFTRGMVSWIGFRQVALDYDRDPRHEGETKYPLRKMVALALDAITSFSRKPLAAAAVLGFAASALAVALMAYSLASWLAGRTVSGWTSVITAVGFFGGVQLLVLGILGEYLGRMYEEMKRRPLVVVEQVLRAGAPAEPGAPPAEPVRGAPAAAPPGPVSG